jgi:hypothetical protein
VIEPLARRDILGFAVEPDRDGRILEQRHPTAVLEQDKPHAIRSAENLLSQRSKERGAKYIQLLTWERQQRLGIPAAMIATPTGAARQMAILLRWFSPNK